MAEILAAFRRDRLLKVGDLRQRHVPTEITGADVNRWFLGSTRGSTRPALHLYAVYQHFNADVEPGRTRSLKHVGAPLDDFQLLLYGARGF